ncbi:MAG: ATP-binding protein [Acidobacteriota bacterium]
MSILVLVSISIRVLNCVFAIILVRRLRDWRLAFLPLMMILTVLRQTIHFFEAGVAWHISWSMPLSEVPGLLLSGITFFLIFFLERIFRERDDAAQALQSSRAKYYTAFRASPDAIAIMSWKDGKLLEVNEGFCRLFGFERHEVVGKTSADLGLWAEPGAREVAKERLQSEGRLSEFESRFRTRAGGMLIALLSIEMIELDGEPCTLTVMRDVSEKRLAEKEREAFVEELEAKNAELERFTYTVSHDLKSPLVTIRGFVGLLKKDFDKGNTAGQRRDLERIDNAASTMGQLLDELLELSRIGRVSNPTVNASLSELALEAADLLSARIVESGVQLEIDRAMPTVTVDRPRWIEVFQNLIENAVKFMGDQANPRIEIGVMASDAQPPGSVTVYVRDNGRGIEQRFHGKIFGLFNRLDQSVEGTGIGLALVKRIVEVGGGKIWVESEGLGQGSTFFFTLSEARA